MGVNDTTNQPQKSNRQEIVKALLILFGIQVVGVACFILSWLLPLIAVGVIIGIADAGAYGGR